MWCFLQQMPGALAPSQTLPDNILQQTVLEKGNSSTGSEAKCVHPKVAWWETAELHQALARFLIPA